MAHSRVALTWSVVCFALAVAAVGADTQGLRTLVAEPVPAVWLSEGPLALEAVEAVEVKPQLLLISPAADEEWLEGTPVAIQWATRGRIETVRLFYYGDVTRLGGRSRGSFSKVIADRIPNEGRYEWQVPWIDAGSLMLRIAGFDLSGKLVAEVERPVRIRPAELGGIKGTFIGIIKDHQRLYYYENDRLKWISLISTAASPYVTPEMHPGSSGRRGEMGQVFYKDPDAFSRMYQVHMRWWMAITSSGSHGIHATSPPFYGYLGSPASHGCVRQHGADAEKLYHMVSVGTSVYVF